MYMKWLNFSDTNKQYQCHHCFSCVDEKNHLFVNRCCEEYIVCRQCRDLFVLSYNGNKANLTNMCMNPLCDKKLFQDEDCLQCNSDKSSLPKIFCNHVDRFYVEENYLLRKFNLEVETQNIFPESIKKTTLRIGLIPKKFPLQFFTDIVFPKFEFFEPQNYSKGPCNEQLCQSIKSQYRKSIELRPTFEQDPDSKTGEKILTIHLAKPFYYTRVFY